MSKIAYVAPWVAPTSYKRVAVHVSVSTEKFLGADLHDTTLCGTKVPTTGWREVPRPTESGWESNLSRCKRCERKRVEGVPAFDYEEELAGRASIHDTTLEA